MTRVLRRTTAVFVGGLIASVLAHGGDGNEHAIEIDGEYSYTELHMAQEHHMDSFDIQAFFHLHDLNRDGILDVNELESIYGVHHEKRRKQSGSEEVHTQTAKEIVQVVLDKLDTDGDGVLTMREFVAGGVGGLPNFKGVEHLGHHYDAEGEYFLHHEEQFHNTPETQNEEDYIHPEDIEHFMAHEKIEALEEERVREFQGLPAEEEEEGTPKPAHYLGDVIKESDEEDATIPQDILLANADKNDKGEAPSPPSAASAEIPFSGESSSNKREQIPLNGEMAPPAPNAARVANVAKAVSDEAARLERAAFAKAQALKFGKDSREASKRGEWGNSDFARPKDPADRLRKNVPYKFKLRKSSWFGDF